MKVILRIMINTKTLIDHNQLQTITIIIFDKILKEIQTPSFKSLMRTKKKKKNKKEIKFQTPF
jgi:hypothetical protein